MSRRRVAVRLYGLTAAISIAVMVALLSLPRFVGSPRYLEGQAALVHHLVDRVSLRGPSRWPEVMDRLSKRLRGKLAMFDADGNLVAATHGAADLVPPTARERKVIATERWAIGWHRIVVRSDDNKTMGVYIPNWPGLPWGFVLPLGAGVLLVVGLATLWFSRRLVRPLDTLAAAARRFGAGDTSARARLVRDDELGDVGRAFDDMADRTALLISSQRQLMADVSHELRTPLARIRVALELAAEDPVAAKDVLTDVGTDLDEIDRLIEDILTTARLDADTAKVKREPISVGELADRAAKRFTTKHPNRILEHNVGDAERALECDPVLLRRAIDNLLDNAAKYSEVNAPVKLDVRPNGKAVEFEIVDHGVGMTKDELERAGTPFWRADGSRARKTGGVGLGLALARRIARAHGGDVSLESTPGRGTTARLRIPLENES